jgi:Ni,Fe-hydrogenase III small subunit/ferredoxin
MLKIVLDALAGGRVTRALPDAGGDYPGAAVGRVELVTGASPAAIAEAVAACPTGAIAVEPGAVAVDDGRCVACGLCAGEAFAEVPVEPSIGLRRRDLVRRFPVADPAADQVTAGARGDDAGRIDREGAALAATVRRRLGRSAHIRHLDAGGCNGCEWELNQLQAPTYDLQRFGLDFVASPRHADVLLVTGVVTRNLELALVRTLDAMPRPRLVLAVGACAISGGVFATSYASRGGADRVVAVDGYVAGCPPRPWAILRGLRLLLAG